VFSSARLARGTIRKPEERGRVARGGGEVRLGPASRRGSSDDSRAG
jgi:hypothetical protein